MKKLWDLLESIIRFFLYKVFRLKLSEENFQKFIQFVQFVLVGLSNAAVMYVVYMLLKLFMPYTVAYVIGYVVSILNSFFWNNTYVFKGESEVKQSWWKTLGKTFISYLGTLILSTVLLMLWVDVLHIPEFLAPIINIMITTPINFWVNKFWAYRGHGKEENGHV